MIISDFKIKSHVPGFIDKWNEFQKKGFNELVVVSVNDPFVSSSWCKEIGAQNKVRMLSDPNAEFTKVLKIY